MDSWPASTLIRQFWAAVSAKVGGDEGEEEGSGNALMSNGVLWEYEPILTSGGRRS